MYIYIYMYTYTHICIYWHVCIVGHIIVTCVTSCSIRSRAKHLTRKEHAGAYAKRRMFVYTPPHCAYMLSANGHILLSLPPRICVHVLVCRNDAIMYIIFRFRFDVYNISFHLF